MKGPIQKLLRRLQEVISAVQVRLPFCITYDSKRVPRGQRPEEFHSLEEYHQSAKNFGEERLSDWWEGLPQEHKKVLSQDTKPLLLLVVPEKSTSAEDWVTESLSDNLASLERAREVAAEQWEESK